MPGEAGQGQHSLETLKIDLNEKVRFEPRGEVSE